MNVVSIICLICTKDVAESRTCLFENIFTSSGSNWARYLTASMSCLRLVKWCELFEQFERCYPLTFSVCCVHLLWFIDIDCCAPTVPALLWATILDFFVKYVLHQKSIWFSPIDEAWYDLHLPFISLSKQMKLNQATFSSFQLVSLISCSALLTKAAQLCPVGLSAPYLMTHAQPTATCCTSIFNQPVTVMLLL